MCGRPVGACGARETECAICGRRFEAEEACPERHSVCPACLGGFWKDLTRTYCLRTGSRDPVEILGTLMRLPGIPMHGPSHHILVGSALMAAYRNSGGEVDLPAALDAIAERMSIVPGAVCGNWGCCGAALSTGTFYSVAKGSGPVAGEIWATTQKMVVACLEGISSHPGPRCCKRDAMEAMRAAAKFLKERDGVELEMPDEIVCGYSGMNRWCLGAGCPYNRANHPGKDPTLALVPRDKA